MKIKKGDKVYFTKESAPNFKKTYLTVGKEYEVISCDKDYFRIISDIGNVCTLSEISPIYLNGGTWLKVKNKKRKLKKEVEDLQRKLETAEQLLKVSRERIDEIIANDKSEKLTTINYLLRDLGDVEWITDVEKLNEIGRIKHTFILTINN